MPHIPHHSHKCPLQENRTQENHWQLVSRQHSSVARDTTQHTCIPTTWQTSVLSSPGNFSSGSLPIVLISKFEPWPQVSRFLDSCILIIYNHSEYTLSPTRPRMEMLVLWGLCTPERTMCDLIHQHCPVPKVAGLYWDLGGRRKLDGGQGGVVTGWSERQL